MAEKGIISKLEKGMNILKYGSAVVILLLLAVSYFKNETPWDEGYIKTVKNMELHDDTIDDLVSKVMFDREGDAILEWSIEGKTDSGKVISVKGGDTKILIYTEKDGDYINVSSKDITVETKGQNRVTLAYLIFNDLINTYW